MFCSKCGTNLTDDVAFCPVCGTKQAAAQPVQPVQQVQPAQPVQPVQPAQPVQLQAAQSVQSSEGMAQGISQGQFNQYNQQVQYNQQYAQMQMQQAQQLPAKKSKKPLIITISILLAAVIIFLIVAFATGLFGKKGIYGTWYRIEDTNEYMIITSNKMEIYEGDELYFTFDVKINDDNIVVKYPFAGTPQTMNYSISGDTLSITNGNGSKEIFTRDKISRQIN